MPVISAERNAQCVPLLDPRALVCANMVSVVQHHFIHCLGAKINTATTLPKTSNTQTINLIYSEVLYPLKSPCITDMSMTCTWHTHTELLGSSQANSSPVVFNIIKSTFCLNPGQSSRPLYFLSLDPYLVV